MTKKTNLGGLSAVTPPLRWRQHLSVEADSLKNSQGGSRSSPEEGRGTVCSLLRWAGLSPQSCLLDRPAHSLPAGGWAPAWPCDLFELLWSSP